MMRAVQIINSDAADFVAVDDSCRGLKARFELVCSTQSRRGLDVCATLHEYDVDGAFQSKG